MTDEDTFAIPRQWRRHLHSRRGDGAELTEAAAAVPTDDDCARVLDHPGSDADLAGAARAYLTGAEVTPLGAAAALAAFGGTVSRAQAEALLDAMVREHGIAFGVAAAVRFIGVDVRGHRLYAGPPTPDHGYRFMFWLPVLRRVREHLALASDVDYEQARAVLAEARGEGGAWRVLASYLMPDQTGWVDDDCRTFVGDPLLLYAVSSADQLSELLRTFHDQWILDAGTYYTLAASVGPAAAGPLARWLVFGHSDVTALLAILAHLPSDEAFALLLERLESKEVVYDAVIRAANRYPRRGIRLLSVAATGGLPGRKIRPGVARRSADLLALHVAAHSAVAASMLATLPDAARERVEELLGSAAAVVAPSSSLPRVLTDPDWGTRRPAGLVVSIPPAPPSPPTLAWLAGERETWAATAGHVQLRTRGRTWDEVTQQAARRGSDWGIAQLIAQAPDEVARPLLERWRPDSIGMTQASWLPAIVARFELDALPTLVHLTPLNTALCGPALLPYAGTELALLMTDWFSRKAARPSVTAWLRRHAAVAATALIPRVFGPDKKARTAGGEALRTIATGGRADAIRAAASAYGEPAVTAIEEFLSVDPIDVTPAKLPRLPAWAPVAPAPVRLREGTYALPQESIHRLCALLSLSSLDEPHPGIDVVRQACDPASLAEFVRALFIRWVGARCPAEEGWVLDALGLFGDDEGVQDLMAAMRSWMGDGAFARASRALATLAAIGTDWALRELVAIAEKTTSAGRRDVALDLLTEAGARRGLTADQLADALVPTLGAGVDGAIRLDYGPRAFLVRFDQHLQPVVSDVDGNRLKALPKPGVRDDPAAYERFAAVKKEARALGSDLHRRFEQAMLTGRRWSGADVRLRLLPHPLLRPVVRGLVWGVFDADGVTAVRIAEDDTFADLADSAVAVGDTAVLGVVHPAELGDDLARWSSLLADYEVLQPFAQLGRERHLLTAEERAATRLARFEGLTVPTTQLSGLPRHGWVEGGYDSGVRRWLHREVGATGAVVVNLDPGLGSAPEQRIEAVWLNDLPDGDFRPFAPLAFGALGAAAASEILRDLTEATRRD